MGVISTQGFQFKLIAGENGVQLDLFKDEDITLSNNVTGIFDIGVLPADFTRQITLPKDIILTGKVHNFDHTSILSKGDVTIMTDEGVTRIKAPATWISKAGTKRLIYVHEETIWSTIHHSEHTLVEDLQNELVHESDLSWIQSNLLEDK